MKNITAILKHALQKSSSYLDYLNAMETYAKEGKSSGATTSESYQHFTKLNFARMKRLTKKQELNHQIITTINNLQEPYTFLVLTETWCGDAAQSLPVIYKVAEQSPHIELKIAYRDENVDLMNEFLTNGNQAIPKLIVLDKENNVVADWGPRPTTATKMVTDYKEKHGKLTPEFKEDLQVWYHKNKGEDTLQDLNNLLTTISKKQTV